MNAAQFYDAFLHGWASASASSTLKRLAGPTLKWKARTPVGAVTFAFATNSKTAGLLPHLPGEFRLGVRWTHGLGSVRRTDEVSWLQYVTDEERGSYAALQRVALEKFLGQPNKEGLRSIFNYSSGPHWLPRANFDEFAYYFNAADARAWGCWYGILVPLCIERFSRAPETFHDWCWRVLWPDAERPREA